MSSPAQGHIEASSKATLLPLSTRQSNRQSVVRARGLMSLIYAAVASKDGTVLAEHALCAGNVATVAQECLQVRLWR
jgi:hypothetical protein